MQECGFTRMPGFTLESSMREYTLDYTLKKQGNGVYAFVLNGDLTINDQPLAARDGFGIWDVEKLTIKSTTPSELLLMEVPMTF
jgi:quercetin 2,3-dioxygenase